MHMVRRRDPLPDERRRPAARELAGVHPDHVRADGPLRGAFAAVLGMLGLNGLPMPYHPVFNVAALRPRVARPLLPLHRVAGSAVRPGEDARVSREPRRAGSHRGGGVSRCRRRWQVAGGAEARPITYHLPPATSCSCRAAAGHARRLPAGDVRPGDATSLSAERGSSRTGGPSRPLPDGTVARGVAPRGPEALCGRGRKDTGCVDVLPMPLTRALLARGPRALRHLLLSVPRPDGERHAGWSCSRGYQPPPSFHIERLREAARRPLLRRHDERASAPCRTTPRRSTSPTAGRSRPTSARCSSRRTPRSRTCRRRRGPICARAPRRPRRAPPV